MLPIFIPSRSRWTSIYAMMQRIPAAHRPNVSVIVPEGQHHRYENVLKNVPCTLLAIPDELRMAGVRDAMAKTAIARGLEYFLMIDDDVVFQTRLGPDTNKTATCNETQTAECLEFLEKYLSDGRWGQVGIPPRLFQNNNPIGDKDVIVKELTRNMCVTGWRTEDVSKIDYTRCVVRSDFDATLQLLRNGRPNINLLYWQHHQVNNTPGGCSDYRTTQVADEAAHYLKSLHPDFVTLREKKYPAQARREELNMGERLEVLIRWRAAYLSGCEQHGKGASA